MPFTATELRQVCKEALAHFEKQNAGAIEQRRVHQSIELLQAIYGGVPLLPPELDPDVMARPMRNVETSIVQRPDNWDISECYCGVCE